MFKLFSRFATWLILTGSAAFAPVAWAGCPPDDCPLNYGFTLTLDTQAQLGGDIYAQWDIDAGSFWGAPLTVSSKLSVPYSLSDSLNVQPPAGSLRVQLTPTLAGYPMDVGVGLAYRYKHEGDGRDLAYEAYAGPLTFSSEGHSWSAAIMLYDSRWFNNYAPPPNFVPTFDFARLTIAPITAPVPELETTSMLLAGLGVVGFIARRRRIAKVR